MIICDWIIFMHFQPYYSEPTGVRYFYFNQMTPTCFGPLFWSTALVQCFGWFTEPTAGSFGLHILSRSPGLFSWCWRQVKKGVAEIAEAFLIESIKMIVMMKVRKFIKSLIGIMFVDQLERQSLSFYTFICLKTDPS